MQEKNARGSACRLPSLPTSQSTTGVRSSQRRGCLDAKALDDDPPGIESLKQFQRGQRSSEKATLRIMVAGVCLPECAWQA